MFKLFKKKSQKEKLQKQYGILLKEAHSLSTINRKLSDQKIYEAEEIMRILEKLE
ncbi:Lacal_2735 family protein [Aquimarina longa]|uniref:Lacal_2735 family protein n=1 Tax=Aquimarina longa TaxID=1080221 RepID=UPI00078227B1|nr:Lacal_2735 family protein [Aquimarina longa]